MKFSFLSFIVIIGCAGPATNTVRDKFDPDEYIVIKNTDIDAIRALKIGETQLPNGNYLVKKSAVEQCVDYTVILASAPITVTIDSAHYLVSGFAKLFSGEKSNYNFVGLLK